MKKLILVALGALTMTGCAYSDKFTGPNGETMVSVSCPGAMNNIGNCIQKVAAECPGGYQLVGSNSESYSGVNLNETGLSGSSGILNREVVAVCK